MTRRHPGRLAAPLLAAALAAACAPQQPAASPAPAPEPSTAPETGAAPAAEPAAPASGTAPAPLAPAPPAGPPVVASAASIAAARADSAAHPWTAADAHFMAMMIPHHAQALEIAALAPGRAENDQVRTLAARIINGQRDEIRIMQQWLADRELPVPDPFGPGGALAAAERVMPAGGTHGGMHGGMHGAAPDTAGHAGHAMRGDSGGAPMPGMLTTAQMQELASARGREFDRLFLNYMIQHHRGAVGMVEALFATHGAGQDETTFRLASDVNVDQITEISRMQRMLLELEFGIRQP